MAKLHISPLFLILFLCFQLTQSHQNNHVHKQEEEGDRITSLPGQPNVTFQQFSGYVTVNHVAGRALFYWLTETPNKPLTKPLLIWLNGGPGCSSVAYGASEEVGPFRINKGATGLHLNKFSWNNVANVLFLETPAGVGFSYSNRSSDLLDTGDRRTSEDSLQFLIRWMERFPRYKNREVYIAGESYAGHYVPQLARQIIRHNSNSHSNSINLKGIMVGNAVTDNYYDNLGTVTYWWSHAMISDKTYHQLINTCDFKRQETSNECESLYSYAMDQEFGNIDQYNIYAPPCNNSDGSRHSGATRQTMRLPHRPKQMPGQLSGYDPCTESYAEVYYNREDVQKAFHANTTRIPYKWTACSETLNRNWNDTEASILPIYRELMAAGLRIWVGGWTEVYEGLTFATVRGAGHEVPLFKPRAALQLLVLLPRHGTRGSGPDLSFDITASPECKSGLARASSAELSLFLLLLFTLLWIPSSLGSFFLRSCMKSWKSVFFLIDHRVIPDYMSWRHPSSVVDDPKPHSQEDVRRLSAHVVKLRDIPDGVLVLSGLIMGIHDFLCLPEWIGTEVQEEPHHDIRPTLQRLPFYYTLHVAVNAAIPDLTLEDFAAGTPSAKVLAKAEASKKQKASFYGAPSSHVAKRTRSAMAQSSGSTTRLNLFADNSKENDDDEDAWNQSGGSIHFDVEGKVIMTDVAGALSGNASRLRPSSSLVSSFQDLSGDAIHMDFFPFSFGPYYALYPKGGVDGSCEFSHEEEMVRIEALSNDQLTTKMNVLYCLMMSHRGELLAQYRGLLQSHHEYSQSANSRLKSLQESPYFPIKYDCDVNYISNTKKGIMAEGEGSDQCLTGKVAHDRTFMARHGIELRSISGGSFFVFGSYGLPPTPTRRALFIVYQSLVPYIAERVSHKRRRYDGTVSGAIANGARKRLAHRYLGGQQQQQNQNESQPRSSQQSFHLVDETEDDEEEEPVPTPTSKKTKVKKVAKTKTKKTQKTQPTTEDEDEAPKRARSLWTDGEELLLAETYIQVSEDPKEGADQQRDTFWYKVMDVYNKEAKRLKYPNRSKNMITGKWTPMNRDVGKFNTIVCETALMSGENDKDFMERCHMLFKRTWKNDFKHSAAWNFLKDKHKWKNPDSTNARRNRLRVTEEDPEHFGPDALPRPDGMYRIQKSQRSSNSTASSGSNPGMFQEMLQQQYELERKMFLSGSLERESIYSNLKR
ncbi:serine carboxypeptidase-like protein 25 [Tanacetum coccineum]